MHTKEIFAEKLTHWYLRNKRDLPWRHTTDPYYIWLSEIILQQTRVNQGLPYYLNFVENFPTIFDLAATDEIEVLRYWQGLGYYSRARNMHQTAKFIVEHLGGKFPNRYTELLQLKGIGPYTAAAIASFAFQEPVAVLDGNVFRVLSRLFGIETDIASHAGKKEFSLLANQLISTQKPDLYNQAIMEFGALLCTPVSPQCIFCPFNNDCVAFKLGKQESLPVKSKKATVKNRFFHYFIFSLDGKIAMKERRNKDIWQGLYDFYLIESETFKDMDDILQLEGLKTIIPSVVIEKESEVYIHVLSHQRIRAKFWHLSLSANFDTKALSLLGLSLYTASETDMLPKPILINKYLNEQFF